MQMPVYLDYSATTPVDPRVVEQMVPWLSERFGNPASRSHAYGWDSEHAVEAARESVAALVGCDAKEIVWTSGATESINLALKGAAHFYKDRGRHLITVKTEHKATLAHSSIRFSVGRFTTEADVDFAVALLREKVGRLREMSPLWEMVKEGIDLNSVQWAAH